MVAGDGADGAGHVDDFRGGKIGGKGRDHVAARHRKLHVTKTQERMAAEKNAVSLDGGDGASRIDGGIALHQNHAGHVAGHQVGILRAGGCGAALRGHQAVALDLLRELLERGRRKPGEDQRRFYEFEGRTRRKPRACEGFRSSTKLRHGKFRDRRRRRMQDILNGRDAGDGLLGEDTELQG